MEQVRIGVIGGSGVYDMEQLKDVREVRVDTPFGAPSDAYVVGTIEGEPVAFLPRHGRGHRISPGRLNARANIYGFKKLGVEYLISISACGSLQPEHKPGDIVVPDQLFDRTRGRRLEFLRRSERGHRRNGRPRFGRRSLLPHPEPDLRAMRSPRRATRCIAAACFVTIEGPRFSTKAESRVFQQLGFAIVGMTAIPEAFLAREAGMSYATMAHVTDYDVWHETEAPVTVDMVIRQLLANAEVAKASVVNAVRRLKGAGPSPYADALRDAIMTHKSAIPPDVAVRLEPLIGRYL